jgi:3-phenylpropionate/trans-cinnamate dioxygenase ferredoxin reductase subunit
LSLGPVVIVGAGHAGVQLAASLRSEGYDDPVVLVDGQHHLPYHRPPLSKGILSGEIDMTGVLLRPETFYRANRIDILLGERAVSVDHKRRLLRLESSSVLSYGHLVLATGTTARLCSLPGADLDGVVYLRTLSDALDLRQRIGMARSVAVIGAGFIGLEIAALVGKLGREVHIIEIAERMMGRLVSQAVSDHFAKFHGGHAQVHLRASATAIEGEGGRVSRVRLADGMMIPADLVLVGIGVTPELELARSARLGSVEGVTVDAVLHTQDPFISAIGDIARHPNRHLGRLARLESVQNANDQARCLAKSLVGKGVPYSAIPWFWSDQAEQKLQIVGIPGGYDRTVRRGDGGSFSIFGYRAERLVAVESVNAARDHVVARKILGGGGSLPPSVAADLSVDLREAARAALGVSETPAHFV